MTEDDRLGEVINDLLPRLLKEFDNSTLSDLELTYSGLSLTLRRQVTTGPPLTTVVGGPAAALAEAQESPPDGHTIVAQMVGTFFSSQAPGKPPYVQEGDVIEKGQVIGIIEAMKVMNELESEVAGRVVRILVKNQQPVEYGQPLMTVVPE